MKKRTNLKHLLILSFILFISLFSFKQAFGEELTITPDNFFDNFQLNGQSSYDSNSKIITLTKDENNQSGSVVLKSLKMDLNYAFSFNADINIGSRTQALGGADGIGIVLHPGNLGDLGGNGGSFGMMSLKNAFGFKVDTFFNSQNEPLYVNAYDPAWLANNKGQLDYPFGAFMYTQDSGLQVYTLGNGNNYEKPQYVSNPNGTFRNIKIEYNPTNRYLTVYYDGRTWIKDISEWKKNNRYFVLGVAGTTGGQKNLQQIKINKIIYTAETKLELTKSNNKPNGAKVGEVVNYTVKATNNGNLDLVTPSITDILPEGMDKPTEVALLGNTGTRYDLKEGANNANSSNEYYTWNANSRELKVFTADMSGSGTSKTLVYNSKILSGNDGDTKTNTASLAGINDNGIHPEAQSSFKIKGETQLSIEKTNDKSTSGAKVGDTVSYVVKPKNSGNLVLETPFIEDTLPEGMAKPTNIRANTSSDLKEGESNKNSFGEYYTWDQNSRKLKVYFSQTNGLGQNVTATIYYKSKVLSGNDGDTKTNTASLAGINDRGIHPEAQSSFKIKGDPKLEVTKTATPTTAKVGDTVNYTIIGKNTGNATLNDVVFTDVLPEGMSEPTEVTILGAVGDAYKLPKGSGNANQFGEYYEWNASSRTMTVIVSRKGQSTGIIANGTGNNSQRKITYSSKVISGNDGDQKKNTVTFSGSNGPTKPTDSATVVIKGDPKLEVTKTATPTTAKVGDTVNYTIIGKNTGNADLNDVIFTDQLPKGMEKPTEVTVKGINITTKLNEGKEQANPDGEYYEWDDSNQILTVHTSKMLKSNGIKTITYSSKVLSGTDGEKKTNTVTLSGSNGPTKPTDSATVVIKGDPKLEVTKTATPTTAKVGDTVNYTIIGKNTGNATLNDVVFTDVLPEGMSEPTEVTILGAVGDAYKLPKGSGNANQFGEYYEWNASSRTMTVIVSRKGQSTGIIANGTGNNSQRKIMYSSKVISGNDGDQKKNTVTFSGSNGPTKPTDSATVVIKGDPKLEVTKTATPTTAKVGDTVNYTIIGKNTGNARLNDVLFEDILPEGMEKPTKVMRAYTNPPIELKEGKGNATNDAIQEYYTWDEGTRTLKIYAKYISINSYVSYTYDSKVLSGTDGERKTNTVTLSGSNTTQKPTADATIKINNPNRKIILNVKQEVVNKQNSVVLPTTGSLNLKNVDVVNTSNQVSESSMIIPSYEADTSQAFKTVSFIWNEEYKGYLSEVRIPELYAYSGYQLTAVEQTHQSVNRINKPIPVIDYTDQLEYWLTVYIEPKISEDGPPFYNWDYKTNDFGTIKIN